MLISSNPERFNIAVVQWIDGEGDEAIKKQPTGGRPSPQISSVFSSDLQCLLIALATSQGEAQRYLCVDSFPLEILYLGVHPNWQVLRNPYKCGQLGIFHK